MLEELRKKSIQSMKLKLVICVIIIAICMILTKVSFIDYLQGPKKISTTDHWNLDELDGKYVTLEVDIVLSMFAEVASRDTKTNIKTVTSTCYICGIWDEEGNVNELYAIKINNKNKWDVEAVLEDTYNSDTVTKTYQITGTMKKMSGKMLEYYNETIEDTNWSDVAIPYCIYDETINGVENIWIMIGTAVAFITLVIAIFVIINVLRGYHDRYIKRYLKLNQRETMTGIESDYFSANVINKNYRLGRKYFFYTKGGTMSLLPLENQVWAYYYQRTGKNAASQIRFFDLQHKTTYVNISKALADNVLSSLDMSFKHMVVGYDANLQKMYNKNFSEFLNIRYNETKMAAAAQDTFYTERDSTIE